LFLCLTPDDGSVAIWNERWVVRAQFHLRPRADPRQHGRNRPREICWREPIALVSRLDVHVEGAAEKAYEATWGGRSTRDLLAYA